MAWQTPKTNWGAADVPLPDDFNRIEGNVQELQNTKETPAGAQAKANTAEANAKAYTDAHEQKAAPHSGHETPAGAQAKAEAAAGAVQAELDAHLADGAHVPKGLISMWSGLITAIPSGWALCDGQNGTPDLRDRFIMGATSDGDVGETGGQNEVTLTVEQMPSHTHSGSTNSSGSHTHTANACKNSSGSYAGWYGYYEKANILEREGTGGGINSAGSHSHTVTINNTGGGQPHENRPAYYKLAFIMKL